MLCADTVSDAVTSESEQCSCWSFTAMYNLCTLFGCGKSAVQVNLDVYACTNVALFRPGFKIN